MDWEFKRNGIIWTFVLDALTVIWNVDRHKYEVLDGDKLVETGSTPRLPLDRFLKYVELTWL